MSPWDLASVVLKLFTLLSTAVVLGGGFSFFLLSHLEWKLKQRVLSYMVIGASAGIVATILFFLVQLGGINQSGLSGMIDMEIGRIIAQSGLGYACGLRLLGFLSVFPMVVMASWYKSAPSKIGVVSVALSYFSVVLLLGISFSLYGHVAELGLLARFAIFVHVIAVSWWIGSLYPLLLAFRVKEGLTLSSVMERFGRIAVYIVGFLIVTGAYLAINILESPNELLQTPYGTSLLLKLIGVAALLLLAASNKFFIVPKLDQNISVGHLKSSISVEMVVAVVVVAITSYFTTVVGVSHG